MKRTKAEVLRAASESRTLKELGHKLGEVSPERARQILRKCGFNWRAVRKRPTICEILLALVRYTTVGQASAYLGCSKDYIKAATADNGIRWRLIKKEIRRREIMNVASMCATKEELAMALGVGRSRIRPMLITHGIDWEKVKCSQLTERREGISEAHGTYRCEECNRFYGGIASDSVNLCADCRSDHPATN